MRIECINYYLHLITNHLQTEADILKALAATIKMLGKYADGGKPFMAELATIQVFDSYNIDIDHW